MSKIDDGVGFASALRAGVAQVVIPALPAEVEGVAVEWTRWETPPVLSHVDARCDSCDWTENPRLAMGYVEDRGRRLRYMAFRCPRCQEMRVYRRTPQIPGPSQVEVLYVPPRTAPPAVGTAGGGQPNDSDLDPLAQKGDTE